MGRIIFLVEEESMTETLRKVLPKVFPHWQENVDWLPLTHRGKSDLEKSIPKKLRGWNEDGARFVILRDNDGGDCLRCKRQLRELSASRSDEDVLIRIVCQELESWMLGDLAAIKAAYPSSLANPARVPAKYRDPDKLGNAADELAKLVGTKTKVARAQRISEHFDVSRNRSHSFNVFLSGLRRLAQAS